MLSVTDRCSASSRLQAIWLFLEPVIGPHYHTHDTGWENRNVARLIMGVKLHTAVVSANINTECLLVTGNLYEPQVIVSPGLWVLRDVCLLYCSLSSKIYTVEPEPESNFFQSQHLIPLRCNDLPQDLCLRGCRGERSQKPQQTQPWGLHICHISSGERRNTLYLGGPPGRGRVPRGE